MSVAVLWALVPQIACFMPDSMMTQAEKDCCKDMASNCSGPDMSHECCQTVARPDAGTVAKMIRNVSPDFAVVGRTIDTAASPLVAVSRRLSILNSHAPPDDPEASSVILRI